MPTISPQDTQNRRSGISKTEEGVVKEPKSADSSIELLGPISMDESKFNSACASIISISNSRTGNGAVLNISSVLSDVHRCCLSRPASFTGAATSFQLGPL